MPAPAWANQSSMPPPINGATKTPPVFAGTDDQAADDGAPGTEVNPPRISTGSAFNAIRARENCTPSLLPHMMPATSATMPATAQTMTQICFSGMPTLNAA